MKEFNLQTGKLGEEIAKDYLEKNGYKIIERNFKTKYAEIDLVVEKNKELVIVEVRTKRGDLFGTPEESLDKRKLRKLWLNAQGYVSQARWQGSYRVDAVCIILKADNSIDRLNHYPSII